MYFRIITLDTFLYIAKMFDSVPVIPCFYKKYSYYELKPFYNSDLGYFE